MDKITKEKQTVICNQSKFCNGCEHSEEHIKHEMAFPDDCNKSLCFHYGKYAECVVPENVIMEMEKTTTEQLEEILERVEEGTTTQSDADVLRSILFPKLDYRIVDDEMLDFDDFGRLLDAN